METKFTPNPRADWNCFNVAVNSAGNFSSPGFPVSLPVQPVFCEWKIETNSGDDATRRIQLDFHVVDLPRRRDVGHTACSCSYLSFGDFDSLGLRVEYGRVCDGRGFLRPFVSRGPSAWATMISTGDPRRRHRGLLVEVRHLRQHGQSRCMAFYRRHEHTWNPPSYIRSRHILNTQF